MPYGSPFGFGVSGCNDAWGGMSYYGGRGYGCEPTFGQRIGTAINGVQAAVWGVRAIANMFGIGR
jgi:hypothetical protein